ncbi:MAG: HAMP domain-containing sensor histidine kinase [Polyangiales bacterium]
MYDDPDPRRGSLAVRLALWLIVPIALCLVAWGYANVRLRRAEMLDEAAREVRDHGTVLEVALDAILRDRRLAELDEITEDLSRADRVLGVLVFDRGGRPVQSSRSVRALQGAYAPLAARARARGRPVTEVRDAGGRRLYAYAVPVGSAGAEPRGAAVLLRDLSYIDANLRRSTVALAWLALALAVVVATAVSLALRAAVLRPVARLVAAAERVGAGRLEGAVAGEGDDEVGRLGRAFNRMVASLRAARDALAAQNDATLALERRLRHAQRLALVGQMAANVAHQVGSPLNVVLGRARYALRQGGQQERDARHLREIVSGAEQISRVIEQLLSHARRAQGPAEPVDVAAVARDTARFLEHECERRRVRAAVHAPERLVVLGRRDELEQILLNLCVNALQAQPDGGSLDVTVTPREGSVEVAVDDAGPGVPEADRARIFEPFFTTKGPAQGTGLGLAICDELVRRTGGTIRVESSPSGGARFACFLCWAPASPRPVP